MNRGRDSDEETIIFNPKEVNRHHGSKNSAPKLAFGCNNWNKSQNRVAPVTGEAPFNQLLNRSQQQPVPSVYQQPPLPVSSNNVQQQQNVQKQASQVHPGRQQGYFVPQGNLPQRHQYAVQSYQQLQAPNSHYSQGAVPQRMYYDAHPGSTVSMAQMWPATHSTQGFPNTALSLPATHSTQGFPNTAYTYQNPAGQTQTNSMLQMTQQKNKSTPQPMHVDMRLSKQHESGPLSHSNQHERGWNSRYHESHHEERRNKNEFRRQLHKPIEHAFRGFTNRYTCQKLQKDLLVQAEGGLLTFLSLNSQFILKTGWQKEIMPRQKVNDSVAHSVSVNRHQLMSQESISPEETSLSDTTTEYHRALDSASPNEQSEEELQGILSSLSQLPDFNMDVEPETGSISNPGREADRATTDGNHYDQEVTRVSNQYDQEPVTSFPSVPESTIISNSKDVTSTISSEEYESESEDNSSDDDRRRIPSAFCSMGNILRMLNQKAPLTQGGQEAVTGSTISASSSTAQTKGKSQQTSLGNAIANSTDKVVKNSDITSFVEKLKTCPRPVGAPRKCYKDQETPSSKPVNRNVQTPISCVQTNINKDMTTIKKGMLQSFRIPKVKSVLNMSVSSAESTNEPIALNRNVSTEDEGTEDGDSLRSKSKLDNPSDKSSKEKISSASKRVKAKNTDHKLSNQLSKEEGKRKENEKPPKSKSVSDPSRERKNSENVGRHRRDSSSENKQTPRSKTASGPSRERKNSENEKGQKRDSSNENKRTPKSKTASGRSRSSEHEEGLRRDASSENKDNKIKCVSKKKPKDKKEKDRGERQEDRNNKKQKVMDKNHNNSPETENVNNNNNNNNNPKEFKDREKSLKIDSRRKSEKDSNGKRSSSKQKDSTNKKEDNKKAKDTGNSIREVKERQQLNEPSTQPRDKRERRKSSEDSMRERSASREKLNQSKVVRETTAKRKGLEETEDGARKRRITESGVQEVSNRESQNPPPFSTQGQGLSMHIDVASSASTLPDSTTITKSPIPRPVEDGGPPKNIVTPEKVVPTRNSAKDTSVSSRRDSEVTVKPCPKEESSVTHEPLLIGIPLPIAVKVKSEPLSPEGQLSSAEQQSCTHTSIKMEQSTISQSNRIEANSALTNISGAVESQHRVETIIPKEFKSVRVPVISSNVRCSRTGASDDVKTSPTETSTPVCEPWFEDPSESSESISKTETFESVEETNQVDKDKEEELTSYTKRWLSGLNNYQDSGNPYEDLLKKLKDMGLDIWEEGGCLMYNWEVNLRWLLTHIFKPIDFATFTRNVKHYMTTYASLPLFFEYITGDSSDDVK